MSANDLCARRGLGTGLRLDLDLDVDVDVDLEASMPRNDRCTVRRRSQARASSCPVARSFLVVARTARLSNQAVLAPFKPTGQAPAYRATSIIKTHE